MFADEILARVLFGARVCGRFNKTNGLPSTVTKLSKAAAGKRVQLKKEGLGDAPVEHKLATKKKVEEETPGSWTEPVTIFLKPPEQLDLTEKELATEVTRI